MRSCPQLSFDLSLARGLDYYTGIIYKAIVEASAPPGFKTANMFASSSTSPSIASDVPPPAQQPQPQKKSVKKEKAAAGADEEEDLDLGTLDAEHLRGEYHLNIPHYSRARASPTVQLHPSAHAALTQIATGPVTSCV